MDRTQRSLRIFQISTTDIGGGAEKVAWNLFHKYRQCGHQSYLGVGYKRSSDYDVLLIPNEEDGTLWTKSWRLLRIKIQFLVGRIPGTELLCHCLYLIAQPKKIIDQLMGREDFNFTGTRKLLSLKSYPPDIIHCHNLHGGYFDLRELPVLSQRVPVVLTLHDAWLLSGHCAHSFDCELWKTGCGVCSNLTVYPAIKRDAASYNWKRKRDIYNKSRLYVATPCQWLMDKVQQSILAPSIVKAKIIPHGVDLGIFHPYDQEKARKELGLDQKIKILLFAANGIRQNIWKDYKTLRSAVSKIGRSFKGNDVLFLALGETAPPERIGHAEVQFIPYQQDPSVVARYYQATDVYIHAAREEVWGLTITEAMACGTPVVVTAVGGIPEQIEDGVTGFLTPPGDADAMAARIEQLLSDDELRRGMGVQAAKIARCQFSLERQVTEYLNWYEEILEDWGKMKKVGEQAL